MHQQTFVPIVRRERLTKEGSDKETFHLELDLSGTNINYSVGDCVAIYPHNDPKLVETILSHFPEDRSSMVTESDTFHNFLKQKANLLRAPKKLRDKLGVEKVDYLTSLLPCPLSAKEFCSYLAPLLPRFYSIASSMKSVKNRIDLLITINENPADFPLPYGTCSHYLCHRAPINQPLVSLYHERSKNFYLSPESSDKPIIMIGPGTGIAPFRGFMQERTCPKNWIFFGERRKAYDFYYEDEWQAYINQNKLRLTTAFSRDGDEKVYVQHKMLEHQKEIWEWLEQGAYIFVCGDAKKMAKDVEKALIQIITTHSDCEPKAYIKNLKRQNRYQRDVY